MCQRIKSALGLAVIGLLVGGAAAGAVEKGGQKKERAREKNTASEPPAMPRLKVESSMVQDLGRFADEDPQLALRLYQLALDAYQARRQLDRAQALSEAIVQAFPEDAYGHLRLAQAFVAQGKEDEAIKHLKQAITLKPQDATIWSQLLSLYVKRQQWDDAERLCRALLQTATDAKIQAYLNRQLVFIAKQQNALETLLKGATAAVAKNPSDRNAHWQLIEGYMTAGKMQESLTAAQRAAKRFPNETELQLRLLSAYQSTGKWDQAISGLKKILAKDPRNDAVRMQLMQAYAGSGRTQEALALLEEAAHANPNNPVYAEQIAEVYVRGNQLDEAMKRYEALLPKATEEWRKTNYESRIQQLKEQKQRLQLQAQQAQPAPAAAVPAAPAAPEATPVPVASEKAKPKGKATR